MRLDTIGCSPEPKRFSGNPEISDSDSGRQPTGFGTLAERRARHTQNLAELSDFDQIVERHSSLVYNVALRMMGNPHDAEDVSQEALLSAYRAFGRFRGESKVTTWLYRITVNAALMRLRKEKKARTLTQTGLDDMDVPDWSGAPERFAYSSELGERIGECLDMLPDNLKAAVVLRDVEGLSNAEAADSLDVSVASLKSRLHRGRVLVRKCLEGYMASLSES